MELCLHLSVWVNWGFHFFITFLNILRSWRLLMLSDLWSLAVIF